MPSTKHLFGGRFVFQTEKKVCFQIWLILMGQFNNIFVAYSKYIIIHCYIVETVVRNMTYCKFALSKV